MTTQNRRWWKEAVVYQIYPRSFQDTSGNGIGDIPGIISRLDHLVELGVNCVWLNPIYASPNDDNGYDISDYSDIMAEFGTMDDFKHLLSEMKRRDIRLIMDLVVNHSSDEHAWFVESRQSKDNPYRDYYFWAPPKPDGSAPNNWVSVFSGPAWELDPTTGEYFLHLFSKKQPDLNWRNEALRQSIYQMMNQWFDMGVDGFRMDVINMISKVEGLPSVAGVAEGELAWGGEFFMNGPLFHDYMQELHQETLAGRDVMTVGECFDLSVEQAKELVGEERKELHMVFQMNHMSLDHGPHGKWDYQGAWSRVKLKQILNEWILGLEGIGWNSQFWMNHDQPRAVSRFGDDSPTYREKSAKALATITLTLPGTPYIYQGEEIAMTNVAYDIEDYRDLEVLNYYNEQVARGIEPSSLMYGIHHICRDNSRTPMQWDDSPQAGFTQSQPWLKINPNYTEITVKESKARPDSTFHYYRRLIQLRKDHIDLVYGNFKLLLEEHPQVFAFERQFEGRLWLTLVNLSSEMAQIELPASWMEAEVDCLLSNETGSMSVPNQLTPWAALVFRKAD